MPDFVLLIVGSLVPIAALVLALASGGVHVREGTDADRDADTRADASPLPLAGEG